MVADDGGERDRLAPVIPLFGDRRAFATPAGEAASDDVSEVPDAPRSSGSRSSAWNHTWGRDTRSAPLGTTSFGASAVDGHEQAEGPAVRPPAGGPEVMDPAAVDPGTVEKRLLRRLASRSLSVREARSFVRELGLGDDGADEMIARFEDLGYLDDAVLAEQLVYAAVERKKQGRRAVAQLLTSRGVPREVADAALSNLPGDEAERALEFARSKTSSLRSLDHDVALRRLLGQLARRGYAGSLAMDAARQALSESGSSGGGVRFR